MHLEPVDLPDAREEEDVVVRRCDEEMLDVVVVLHVHPHHADPAAALLAIRRHRQALDVAGARDRDDHVLLGDHVFELERVLANHDLGAALVGAAVPLLHLEQLLTNERVDPGGISEDGSQLGDALFEVGELCLDLLARKTRESRESQIEDRLGLLFREAKVVHQARSRRLRVVRAADQRDHGIEVVERDQVAPQNVGATLLLPQLELRTTYDDLALEVEVMPHDLEQRHHPRDAVCERDGVVAERRLERRVLEELVQGHLRDRVALQLDLDPHARPVRVVGKIRDLGDHLVVDEVGDLLDHAGVAALLDPIREFGDDDRALPAAQLLDVGTSPHHNAAAAGSVGVSDSRTADDDRSRREVRAFEVLHQILDVGVGLIDQLDHGIDRLTEMVRRHVRRHSDGNPGRAVDQQVREPRRHRERLLARLVVVRPEVDRVHVDVAQHLGREARETAFGVPHGGWWIVIQRAEVALSVDERIAQRKRLGHPHERVVDRLVAVRVVAAHHIANDRGGLLVGPVRLHAGVVHTPEDAAMDGLESIPHVG